MSKDEYLKLLQNDLTDLVASDVGSDIFESFDDAYETIREYLNMSFIDFKKFIKTEEFDYEWQNFRQAEQEYIMLLKSKD